MNKPKRHHYLPETYLKGFSADGRGLWVYHIDRGKLVPQTISDTCVQSYYNAFANEDGTKNIQVEENLSQIESEVATVIKRIDDTRPITGEQKELLAFFVSLQRLRVPEFEGDVNRIAEHTMTRLIKLSLLNEERAQAALDQFTEATGTPHGLTAKEMVAFGTSNDLCIKANRNLSLEMMVTMAPEFAAYFVQMEWAFLRAPKGSMFITTDSPFMLIEPAEWRQNGRPFYAVWSSHEGSQEILPTFCENLPRNVRPRRHDILQRSHR